MSWKAQIPSAMVACLSLVGYVFLAALVGLEVRADAAVVVGVLTPRLPHDNER